MPMAKTQKENKNHQLSYVEFFQDIILLSKNLFTQWSNLKISPCFKS